MIKPVVVQPFLWAASIVAILFWLALPSGLYLGGDWTLPATLFQLSQFCSHFVWLPNVDFGLPNFLDPLCLSYGISLRLLNWLGVSWENFGRLVVTFIFAAATFNFCRFVQYLGFKKIPSVVGAFVYALTPVFFNYLVMGWPYALFAMALLPLAAQWFCQMVNQKSNAYAFGVAAVWSLAMLQSQSLIWFPLLFIVLALYLSSDWSSAKFVLKKITIVLIFFIVLNAYWWLAIALFQEENLIGNAITMSEVSRGADLYFTASNALRLRGSLFNSHYEVVIFPGWTFVSWVLPVLATLAALLAKDKSKKLALAVGLIAFALPAALLVLNEYREVMLYIPGAGLIRQLSRFTVLISFAYAVLIVIFLNVLAVAKDSFAKNIIYSLVLVFLFWAAWPWFAGNLTNNSKLGHGSPASTLTAKIFPSDYYAAEKYLSSIGLASHSLYLPYGQNQSYKDDRIYSGDFHEAGDIFARYSPIPGALMPSDRSSIIVNYVNAIQSSSNPILTTWLAPINFYVLRKNMNAKSSVEIFKNPQYFFPEKLFDRVWDSKNVLVYARKFALPLIHSPAQSGLIVGDVGRIDPNGKGVYSLDGAAQLFIEQNIFKLSAFERFLAAKRGSATVEYRRINPTKYRIRLHHVKKDFPLLFGESYSRGWRLYPMKNIPTVNSLSENDFAEQPRSDRYQAGVAQINEFYKRGTASQIGAGFVSELLLGSIQNDNLVRGFVTDTWNSRHLPDEQHIMVNGYANGWVIDIAQVCESQNVCHRNADGSYDLEIVMEFWPQQIFYLGLAITLLGFFVGAVQINRELRGMKKYLF